MEAFETTGKGGPTWMRRALFQRIIESLKAAKGERVKFSPFIAGICVSTGLKRKTVSELFELMGEASIIEFNEAEDWVCLVGAEE